MTDPRNEQSPSIHSGPLDGPPVPPVPPAPPADGYGSPPPVPGDAWPPPPAPGYQAPGYQAPGHQAPAYAAPGYPAGGYPAGSYPAAVPPRGLLPWALGLLILFPVPFVGGFASGLAMALGGGASRRFGGVARENARNALNWGLTYLLVSTTLLVSHFVILFTLTADSPTSGFYPIGIPITIYFALSLMHLVIVIIGMVKSSGGSVMRVPFAIPYVRA